MSLFTIIWSRYYRLVRGSESQIIHYKHIWHDTRLTSDRSRLQSISNIASLPCFVSAPWFIKARLQSVSYFAKSRGIFCWTCWFRVLEIKFTVCNNWSLYRRNYLLWQFQWRHNRFSNRNHGVSMLWAFYRGLVMSNTEIKRMALTTDDNYKLQRM